MRERRSRSRLTPIAAIMGMAAAAMMSFMPLVRAQSASTPPQTPLATETESVAESGKDELIETITLPLTDGSIDLGDVLGDTLEAMGITGSQAREIDLILDLQSIAQRAPLHMIELATGGVVRFDVGPDALTMTIDRLRARSESQRIRSALRRTVERLFPEAAAKASAAYGFRVYEADADHYVGVDEISAPPPGGVEEAIVLIHGLDDPARIWLSLRPAIIERGATVLEFHYPNDQRISDSAEFFASELRRLRDLGFERISIVAHSMGGLVARDALTRDTLAASDVTGASGDYPAVDRLIMVGTPNHGSALARLHIFSEVRDQVARSLSGDGLLFGAIFDGAGEAQIDLLPQSEFLTALNARPLPRGLDITIIAGDMSPITGDRLESLGQALGQFSIIDDPEAFMTELKHGVNDLTAGLGDGCVSLESCRLEGVTHVHTVAGNHLTMIRNYRKDDPRIPPAVPIILDRLYISDEP